MDVLSRRSILFFLLVVLLMYLLLDLLLRLQSVSILLLMVLIFNLNMILLNLVMGISHACLLVLVHSLTYYHSSCIRTRILLRRTVFFCFGSLLWILNDSSLRYLFILLRRWVNAFFLLLIGCTLVLIHLGITLRQLLALINFPPHYSCCCSFGKHLLLETEWILLVRLYFMGTVWSNALHIYWLYFS